MSSRWLIIISSVLSVLAVYLYLHRDKIAQPKATFDARFDYWAEDIVALQTDDTGAVDMAIHAKKLTHELQTDTLTLVKMQAKQIVADDTQPETAVTLTFSSDHAVWQRKKNTFTLADNVTVARTKTASAEKQRANDQKTNQKQQLKAKNLHYHTKTKQLSSKFPVVFTSGNSYIKANALQANLGTGIYQFDFLQAQYAQ